MPGVRSTSVSPMSPVKMLLLNAFFWHVYKCIFFTFLQIGIVISKMPVLAALQCRSALVLNIVDAQYYDAVLLFSGYRDWLESLTIMVCR